MLSGNDIVLAEYENNSLRKIRFFFSDMRLYKTHYLY